nr:reverse transcriptase domain-containing protein [Tanacetum cinerariifolium]
MPPRMRTGSASWLVDESRGGGTIERVGISGRGRGPRGGNDKHVDELNGQGNNQGLGANGHEMQKLETELWNHTMFGVGHAAYTDRFHELARLVPHLVTPESRKIERNGSFKKVEKRGNAGEPSKDKNGMDDNKRTRSGNAFDSTTNPVGRESMGAWPKGVPRNVNPVKARNPTVKACYECGSTNHIRSACSKLNRAQGLEENYPNHVATNNGGRGHGNQGNQARGRAFMLGVEEAHQDPSIVTRLPPLQKIEFRVELIPVAVSIAKSPYRLAPSELEELSGQLKELQNKGFIRPSSSP